MQAGVSNDANVLVDLVIPLAVLWAVAFHCLRASKKNGPLGRSGLGCFQAPLAEREFELEAEGYTATRHQREVGAGYFDQVLQTITGGNASTLALHGSTEEEQFETDTPEIERSAA